MTLNELAAQIGATVRGNGELTVTGLATLANAGPQQVGFLANEKYKSHVANSKAAAVIIHPDHDEPSVLANALISSNPYLSYAKAAQVFDDTPKPTGSVDPRADIHASAELGENVTVGPFAVISAGAKIADGVVIGANSFIGEAVVIGAHSRLMPGVSVYHKVQIGSHCTLHSGAVVGADGFGWASDGGKWVKIPQLGRVVIGNHVEIGANTCIDRGALDDTVIGDNCIIDNLVMVAHNVQIGSGTAIAGQTGIAGSATIGKHCLIGGAAGINGHITIADGVQIHGMTMVTKNLEKGVYASSLPVVDQTTWAKSGARVRQLPELFMRVRAIEKKLSNSEE